MSVRIGSNIASLNAQRRLSESTGVLSRVYERLSSGQRINRASDDAAGLSISTSLSARARIFNQGLRNVNDGQSFLNIAQGALSQLSTITIRQLELSEQAANGVYSSTQRGALNQEANALVEEFNRIVASSTFNGLSVVDIRNGSQNLRIQAGFGLLGGIGIGVGDHLKRAVHDGTFREGAIYDIGGGEVESIKSVDINGDGVLDLLSVGSQNGNLVVSIGNGDGTFGSTQTFSTIDGADHIVTGDLNGDGFVDVITGGGDRAKTSVFLGNGDGTFQAAALFDLAINARSIALGDLNGDGELDIVAGHVDGSISIALGDGVGGFGALNNSLTSGDEVRSLALGDINGDGILDIVAGSWGSNFVSVLLGVGDGTFGSLSSVDAGDNRHASVRFADLNADGKLDLVVGTQSSGIVSTLLGDGDGSFNSLAQLQVAQGYNTIVNIDIADINGDGILDIAAAMWDRRAIMVLWGAGDGTLTAGPAVTSTSKTGWGVTLGDFDGDGRMDIAATEADRFGVYLANEAYASSMAQIDLSTMASARQTIATLNAQLERITSELGSIGSHQSRLFSAMNTLSTSSENSLSAASRIQDVDVAEESSALIRQQLIQQAASAILAQANQQPALAISLLR